MHERFLKQILNGSSKILKDRDDNPGGGGGGYSRFQVMGMIEGFFLGLKFSIPGFFGVGKFGKYFFVWLDLSGDLSSGF